MPNHLDTPGGFVVDPDTRTSVRIYWRAVTGATAYEVRGAGTDAIRRVESPSIVIRGLYPARRETLFLRAVDDVEVGEWAELQIRSTAPIPIPPEAKSAIPLIDADRQSMILRLPDANGQNQDVQLSFWWSPSDSGWWGSIDVPTNTPSVSSRRLGLNCGILDAIKGVLAGNIVMRATGDTNVIEDEPTRGSIAAGTHALYWEPSV